MERVAYYQSVRRLLIIILVINLSVAAVKTFYGFVTGSLAMTSDGLHSFFDGTSNLIGLVGIALASRPPDKSHPYGHAKYETMATVAVAAVIFASCIQLVETSIHRLMSPTIPTVNDLSYAVMIATLMVNIAVSTFEYRSGKKLKSEILIADSLHTRSDVLASLAVILGLAAVQWGYPMADPIIALVVTGLIIRTGIEILHQSSSVLTDRALLGEAEVRSVAQAVDGVEECHNIRSRGSQGCIFVDLHLGVDPELSVTEADMVAKKVEEELKAAFPGLEDVTVHIEPSNTCQRKGQPSEALQDKL